MALRRGTDNNRRVEESDLPWAGLARRLGGQPPRDTAMVCLRSAERTAAHDRPARTGGHPTPGPPAHRPRRLARSAVRDARFDREQRRSRNRVPRRTSAAHISLAAVTARFRHRYAAPWPSECPCNKIPASLALERHSMTIIIPTNWIHRSATPLCRVY